MYKHETQIRVRYAETDQMGYVYYGNYARYYEVGRVEAMRNLGLRYALLESEHGILMPVLSMETRFVRPAKYDEMLTMQTYIPSMPDDKITFKSEIYNDHQKLVNGGVVRLFFLDKKTKERIPTPKIIADRLRPYFET